MTLLAVRIGETLLPTLRVNEVYKYLGVNFGAKGTVCNAEKKLRDSIQQISEAPLKPQQRLYMFINHALPGALHTLVLAKVTKGYLQNLDRIGRFALRKWLKLPGDTPNAYFYSHTRDGGLGIMNLSDEVMAMKLKRFNRLHGGRDGEVLNEVCLLEFNQKYQRDLFQRVTGGNIALLEKRHRLDAWAEILHKSCDGRGLKNAPYSAIRKSTPFGAVLNPVGSKWLKSGFNDHIPGFEFCKMVGLRAGTLETKARAARRRGDYNLPNPYCDKCFSTVLDTQGRAVSQPMVDSLAHRLQVCSHLQGLRIARHDSVQKKLSSFLSRRGWVVEATPRIPTSAGPRYPDLIIRRGSEAWVIDVQIGADNLDDPDQGHKDKVIKYSNTPEIMEYALRGLNAEGQQVGFSACFLNWRGFWSLASVNDLKRLGISGSELEALAKMVVRWGVSIWRKTRDSTYRVNTGIRQRLGIG